MRISDWSSDVCSSDLRSVAVRIIARGRFGRGLLSRILAWREKARGMRRDRHCAFRHAGSDERHGHDHIAGERADVLVRSEEHTSELQSLMRISYAVFCLKKKKKYYTLYIKT